jgi:hypothetical protein
MASRVASGKDNIEEAFDAQKAFQEPLQTQMVAGNVRALLDSGAPNGRRLTTA